MGLAHTLLPIQEHVAEEAYSFHKNKETKGGMGPEYYVTSMTPPPKVPTTFTGWPTKQWMFEETVQM